MTSKWAGAVFVLAAVISGPRAAWAGCWDGCCRDWSEYERACRCSGGTPYPNPARCETGGGYTPPLPVDPRPAQLERYRALISKGLVDDAAFAASPVDTDTEFARTLGELYAALSRSQLVSQATRGVYNARGDAEWAQYRDFFMPRFALIDVSDGLVPELRDSLAAEKGRLAAVEAETRRLAAVRRSFVNDNRSLAKAADLLKETALTTKLRVAAHLGGLSASEVESTTPAGSVSLPLEPPEAAAAEAEPWYLNDRYLPHPSLEAAIDASLSALSLARVRAIASIGGSVEDRLQFAEKMAEGAAAARRSADAAFTVYNTRRLDNEAAARQWASRAQTNRPLWEEARGLRAQGIPKAKSLLKWTQDTLKSEAWEFAANGGKGAAWGLFRKSLLDPELKRVADEVFRGRTFVRTDDEIRQAWKLGTPLVAPAITNYSRVKKLHSLKAVVASLNGNFQESTLAAAELLGQAAPGEAEDLGRKLTAGLDAEARKEVRFAIAQTDLPLAFKKYWEAAIMDGR
ncbi:MAG: hypothetical protein HY928_05960 [Elusimicrobia bacterium]|nr:hypothetical protein [Elusimicrobiota bacterium]